MAIRPVFIPLPASVGVDALDLEFDWAPGFALSQKRKSIASLHDSARAAGLARVLEVSSKSVAILGRQLSAFDLLTPTPNGDLRPVECVFQGAKAFEHGGPFTDLYDASPREAKRDRRLSESGPLQAFAFGDDIWPLVPRTAFYDWVYLEGLRLSLGVADQLLDFDAFTDIEFNPRRSINCQARTCALYVAIRAAYSDVFPPRDRLRSMLLAVSGDRTGDQSRLFDT